jgi:hypothetical protein
MSKNAMGTGETTALEPGPELTPSRRRGPPESIDMGDDGAIDVVAQSLPSSRTPLTGARWLARDEDDVEVLPVDIALDFAAAGRLFAYNLGDQLYITTRIR